MSRGTIFQSQSQKIGPWGHVFLTTLPVTTPPALCHEHLPAMTYWFTYTHNVTTLQLHDCQPTSHVDHPPTTSTNCPAWLQPIWPPTVIWSPTKVVGGCSATSRTCVVRRTYSNYGDRCFAAAGPKLWNSLPTELRQADISFQRFKQLLKTFLFWFWEHSCWSCTS